MLDTNEALDWSTEWRTLRKVMEEHQKEVEEFEDVYDMDEVEKEMEACSEILNQLYESFEDGAYVTDEEEAPKTKRQRKRMARKAREQDKGAKETERQNAACGFLSFGSEA